MSHKRTHPYTQQTSPGVGLMPYGSSEDCDAALPHWLEYDNERQRTQRSVAARLWLAFRTS